MLLNDIGKTPDATFKKVNRHLEANYGFKISEDVSDKDLVSIMEQIQEEITDLKIKGDDSKASPEISKRLLVLEGIRSLREFVSMNFQSPDLERVVNGMCDFVCDNFRISGMSQADLDETVRDAMKHYRSSKYRFPDDIIEQRVRSQAMAKLASGSEPEMPMMEEDQDMNIDDLKNNKSVEEAGDPWGSVGKRAQAIGGHAADPSKADSRTLKVLDNPALSLKPEEDDDMVPMIRDKSGRLVPDPFAAQKAAMRKGRIHKEEITMEKTNLVKNLRRLLETEVSQAEVMMAAKGFAQELQEMVEKIGRLQNEDLPPVTDQMRETYGTDAASAFQTQIYGALQSVMDSLYTAKNQVDDAVSNMAATGTFSAETDMDKDIGDEMGAVDADVNAMDAELDLDNLDAELDAEDDFGAADEEEPLGRAMKTESLQRQVVGMKRLIEKARKLKEARG